NGINDLVIKKQFQEERKIQILVATQRVEQKQVDECQDLKAETLRLITKIFGSEGTSFTFVGDPKQNIYGFAGATEDIFTLLEQQFPQQTQSIIATSFRLSPEIAEYSNDFIK
ncbi:12120_t:CDS:2, partial [Funneliformis geosporum]